jgi:hypothetical protein
VYLEPVEFLSHEHQAYDPDYNGSDAVQNHPGGCGNLFGDAYTREVEESDGDNRT